MIASILLVFAMNDLPPRISQRKFVTLDECADYVEFLAGQQVVDDEDHFEFKAMEPSDGSISTFQGRCVVESNVEKPI